MAKTLPSLPPILFEDEGLIVFDKPSGWLTVKARWDTGRSDLVTLARENLPGDLYPLRNPDAAISGVLLCAKSRDILKALEQQDANGKIQVKYTALVVGSLPEPEMIIRREIENNPGDPARMRLAATYRKGKCRTQVNTVEIFRAHSLLAVGLNAGKRHQARVHLAYIGCPVVADSLYGDGHGLYLSGIKGGYKFKAGQPERPLIARLALHLESMTLTHPATQAGLTITAPWPKDFDVSIKYLRRFASCGACGETSGRT